MTTLFGSLAAALLFAPFFTLNAAVDSSMKTSQRSRPIELGLRIRDEGQGM
jgi:hypothetical protein